MGQFCAPESGTDIHSRSSYQVPLPLSGADKPADSYESVLCSVGAMEAQKGTLA